uniref:Uncharacterized protein n=1 Tax=Rhizophora mucronata TaxID=61149 RepID=A0A2P2K625_RHIMU
MFNFSLFLLFCVVMIGIYAFHAQLYIQPQHFSPVPFNEFSIGCSCIGSIRLKFYSLWVAHSLVL